MREFEWVDDSFLSRLCGGEDFCFNAIFDDSFLSRLCGGEATCYPNSS